MQGYHSGIGQTIEYILPPYILCEDSQAGGETKWNGSSLSCTFLLFARSEGKQQAVSRGHIAILRYCKHPKHIPQQLPHSLTLIRFPWALRLTQLSMTIH